MEVPVHLVLQYPFLGITGFLITQMDYPYADRSEVPRRRVDLRILELGGWCGGFQSNG